MPPRVNSNHPNRCHQELILTTEMPPRFDRKYLYVSQQELTVTTQMPDKRQWAVIVTSWWHVCGLLLLPGGIGVVAVISWWHLGCCFYLPVASGWLPLLPSGMWVVTVQSFKGIVYSWWHLGGCY